MSLWGHFTGENLPGLGVLAKDKAVGKEHLAEEIGGGDVV